MSTERYWIGFDLGGTKMLAKVFDGNFEPVAKERKRTKGYEGSASGVQRIAQTIRSALAEAKIDESQVGGIGIGVPGPVDLTRGVIIEAANLGWKDVPLKKQLEKEFKCPVEVLNDVDAGVFGEYRFGAAKDARCVVGVFPGTGIGGGCVYEGKIFHGSRSSCMEVGHVYMMPDGPFSGFAQRGVLEALASRLAISAEAAQACFRGLAPYLMENAGTDLMNIRSGVLAASIAEGDVMIEKIVKKAAGHVGIAVANLVNLLCPDVVVLGGGLVEAMPDLFLGEVRAATKGAVMPGFRDFYKLVAAQLGDDASVKGAAGWVESTT